jgi:ribosome biogenesis GTPase
LDLSDYGWDDVFEERFGEFRAEKLFPARVIASSGPIYTLVTEKGEVRGKFSGKFRSSLLSRVEFPTVGDWVAFTPIGPSEYVSIRGLVERKNKFSRKVAGSLSEEQVIAANIDTIFIVSGMDEDYSIRRLERYVTLAADSNAQLVFILNKADLRADLEKTVSEIKGLFPGALVYAISALNNRGLEQLSPHILPGKTIVFLGSSGAGKSTIVNRLLGEDRQKTGPVSAHTGKGRHITSSKNLIVLPDGAIVIDTPGLRELQLLCSGEGIKNAFADIEELSGGCKYRRCTHTNEPGCAVLKAAEEGLVTEERLASYHKLKREIAHNLMRHEAKYKNKRSKFSKAISRRAKQIKKSRERSEDKYLGE